MRNESFACFIFMFHLFMFCFSLGGRCRSNDKFEARSCARFVWQQNRPKFVIKPKKKRCETIQNHGKINRPSIKNPPPKSIQNQPKSSQDRSKSVKNRSNIDQKSIQNQLWDRLRFRDRFRSDFDPILVPAWGRLGDQIGAMLANNLIFGGS